MKLITMFQNKTIKKEVTYLLRNHDDAIHIVHDFFYLSTQSDKLDSDFTKQRHMSLLRMRRGIARQHPTLCGTIDGEQVFNGYMKFSREVVIFYA